MGAFNWESHVRTGGSKLGQEGIVLDHLDAVADSEGWAQPSPNIAPTNAIPGVRIKDGRRNASSHLWGFMPPNGPSRARWLHESQGRLKGLSIADDP